MLSIFPDLRATHASRYVSYSEVFLDIPLEEAMRRDAKSIYARAMAKEINNVVGVDLPFPRPENADLVIEPPELLRSPDVIAARIYDAVLARHI